MRHFTWEKDHSWSISAPKSTFRKGTVLQVLPNIATGFFLYGKEEDVSKKREEAC
jgi:hypothetical protein